MRTVVIGSSHEQKLPSLVLEHTIAKRSVSAEIRVVHTYDMSFPVPRDPALRSRTGFSFSRFAIPGLVGYRGAAAYLECDQIVFRDVNELFDLPFDGATILRTREQTSVLLLDCERLRWDVTDIVADLDARKISYKGLMAELCIEPSENIRCSIPPEWNSLEKYLPGETALLHYTNMDQQPWRKWWDHPLKHLWMKELQSAMSSGFIQRETVEKEVALGHIVPQVLEESRKWESH